MTTTATSVKPMLAKTFDGQNVTGWLMSEKLDGVRAIWDGSKFLSRNGNQFFAPEWFTSQLPAGVTLDGELFIGRGKFQSTVGVVRKKVPMDSEWSQIRFCVFDAPECPGGFEERLEFCAEAIQGSTVASVVPHRACLGDDDLDTFRRDLCSAGAEGVMLRAPGSKYDHRRSDNLLKYKQLDADEAVLIGTAPGIGRLSDTIGALILKWGKVTFRVGSGLNDEIRQCPPPIGTKITFGFCGFTDAGVPRFPTFLSDRCYE